MKPPLRNVRFAYYFTGLLLLIGSFSFKAIAQCNTLKPQITIDFNTDQPCSPVTVTKFDITFYFTIAQNPADIAIRYEWNDPANTVTTVSGAGLISGAGFTTFRANATFMYTSNNSCTITPTAYIVIGGTICTTSQQIQTAFFWDKDDNSGSRPIDINPDNYDVCFNNPITNATFRDNTQFNCNPIEEPDNPNQLTRHVQFVYGTNHNAAATIRNLTLTDAGVQPLTNGTGALVNPVTRG